MFALLEARSIQHPTTWQEALLLLTILGGIILTFSRTAGLPIALLVASVGYATFSLDHESYIPAAILAVGVLSWTRPSGVTKRPVRPFLIELLLLTGGFALYELGRLHSEGSIDQAQRNAVRIIDLERSLGLAFEESVQAFVLRSRFATEVFNEIYSFMFLSITMATLLWLYLHDQPNYRLFRNCLGISAALAVITIALFPVAPPRLMPDSGLLDSHALLGRHHGFVNEYAAVPSLHVGWMALSGFVLGRSLGGLRGRLIGPAPGLLMLFTVMTTGNHYWLDGAIGAAYCLAPALVLTRVRQPRELPSWLARQLSSLGAGIGAAARATWQTLATSDKARNSMLALGSLLGVLLVGQRVNPGFTDFWGYQVFQISATMLLALTFEVVFARQGGLSWITHTIVAVTTIADSLGTAGHMYENFVEYDKITHFMGGVALSAVAYDLLLALNRRGVLSWRPTSRLLVAAMTAFALGAGWEVYEYVGDHVFNTARVGGLWDTTHDLFSDFFGDFTGGILLWDREMKARQSGRELPTEASES